MSPERLEPAQKGIPPETAVASACGRALAASVHVTQTPQAAASCERARLPRPSSRSQFYAAIQVCCLGTMAESSLFIRGSRVFLTEGRRNASVINFT